MKKNEQNKGVAFEMDGTITWGFSSRYKANVQPKLNLDRLADNDIKIIYSVSNN